MTDFYASRDFTGRMVQSRDLAMRDRNRGRSGMTTFNRHRETGESWRSLCYVTMQHWQRDKRQALNDFQSACLNRLDDQPSSWTEWDWGI